MSVDYKSALIYGYDCSHLINEISYEDLEELEEIGWDYVKDCYGNTFLYIGIKISCVDCYETVRIDVLKALTSVIGRLKALRDKTPEKFHLPLSGSVYHLCYVT